MASSVPNSFDIRTPEASLFGLDSRDNETQWEYQWDKPQQELIDAHYSHHYAMCIAIQKYKMAGPEGIEWPKKPKGTLIPPKSLKGSVKLTADDLHKYLANNIVYSYGRLSCPTVEASDILSLDQILGHLKLGYALLKQQNAKTLAESIEYGKWLDIALELHYLDKLAGKISLTWEEWLEKNVGISKSYACKLREIAKLLKDYPLFRRLGLSFSEVYGRRKEIKSMLAVHKNIADYWKTNG
jgi:hypothetical protein